MGDFHGLAKRWFLPRLGLSPRVLLRWTLLFIVACAQLRSPQSGPVACNNPKLSVPVQFHGKKLQEAPDLTTPELLIINAQLNRFECQDTAASRLTAYHRDHPEDYRSNFLLARILSLHANPTGAQRVLRETLQDHPEFVSASVLLGLITLDQSDYRGAQVALVQALQLSPTDLWANLASLALAARENISLDAAKQLLEIAKDDKFDGFAREYAIATITRLNELPRSMREEAYRAALGFVSITPLATKTEDLAEFLIEERKDPAQARRVLKKFLTTSPDAEYAKVLLAETYLLEAEAISPTPKNANAALIAEAKALFGNMSPLTRHLSVRPKLTRLQSLLAHAPIDAASKD